jgi:hypothetical protein
MFTKLMEIISNLRHNPTPDHLEEAVQRLIRLESEIANLETVLKNNKSYIDEVTNRKDQEIARLRTGMAKENEEVCQALGKALHYPWFKDDQKNFPGATEEAGVCVGEHVAPSIAEEAAKWIERAWPLVCATNRYVQACDRFEASKALGENPSPDERETARRGVWEEVQKHKSATPLATEEHTWEPIYPPAGPGVDL